MWKELFRASEGGRSRRERRAFLGTSIQVGLILLCAAGAIGTILLYEGLMFGGNCVSWR